MPALAGSQYVPGTGRIDRPLPYALSPGAGVASENAAQCFVQGLDALRKPQRFEQFLIACEADAGVDLAGTDPGLFAGDADAPSSRRSGERSGATTGGTGVDRAGAGRSLAAAAAGGDSRSAAEFQPRGCAVCRVPINPPHPLRKAVESFSRSPHDSPLAGLAALDCAGQRSG